MVVWLAVKWFFVRNEVGRCGVHFDKSHHPRRCFLMGEDPISGKNFDHRKVFWIEEYLVNSAGRLE